MCPNEVQMYSPYVGPSGSRTPNQSDPREPQSSCRRAVTDSNQGHAKSLLFPGNSTHIHTASPHTHNTHTHYETVGEQSRDHWRRLKLFWVLLIFLRAYYLSPCLYAHSRQGSRRYHGFSQRTRNTLTYKPPKRTTLELLPGDSAPPLSWSSSTKVWHVHEETLLCISVFLWLSTEEAGGRIFTCILFLPFWQKHICSRCSPLRVSFPTARDSELSQLWMLTGWFSYLNGVRWPRRLKKRCCSDWSSSL